MSYKIPCIYLLTSFLCFFAFPGCGSSFGKAQFTNSRVEKKANNFNYEYEFENEFKSDIEYLEPEAPQKPLVSGPVRDLPWDGDENFLNFKEKNNTPILMAAYRTVLKDPLPGEEFNVHLAASLLAGTVVMPNGTLSQNSLLGPYTKEKGYREGPTYIGARLTTTIGGGVCKISSTLYNTAILSNLEIVNRYHHSMPVPYVPYGQDATVAYGAKDFKFRNNTDSPIMIWAQGIGNILYIAFYGSVEPPRVEWHHETLRTFKAPYIYKTNPNLQDGEEKMIVEGMDGAIVKSWVSIQNSDGTITTKQLGISNYSPMPHILERNK